MTMLSFPTLFLLMAAPFVGSFLCVLALRLPKGEDVVRGRSRCPSCDLIPVVSWLAARGRCRHCSASVSAIYPAMELAALGIVIWSMSVTNDENLTITVLLGWTLLCLAVMDARSLVLADELTLPLIPAGLAANAWLAPEGLWEHVAAAALAAGLLSALAFAYRRTRGRDGLGYGDVKLFAGAGAWTGLLGLGTVLLWAVVVNVALLLAARLAGREISGTTKVPLGTKAFEAALW